jgi:hypothetical protein
VAIFGFHHVESESDVERQVGGTGIGTRGDQKSGRTRGTIFRPDFARASLVHRLFPSLDSFLSDLRATLRGRFYILALDLRCLTFALGGSYPMATNLKDRPSS